MSAEPTPCTGCGADVLSLRDAGTGESVALDAAPVDGGRVQVLAVGRATACRQLDRPAPRQPAWRLHDCPALPLDGLIDGVDPYEDVPAGLQQARWRQP